MARTTKRALLGAAVAVVAATGLAAPADAVAVTPQYCRQYHRLCMWEDPNYRGSVYVQQVDVVGLYEIDGWDGDNEISSVVNGTTRCVTVYMDDGGRGPSAGLYRGGSWADMRVIGYDNKAESYRILNC